MAAEPNYIKGFKTVNGTAKYDYNALANIPSLVKLLFCNWDTLPPPTLDMVGTIALVEDENQYDLPLICHQRGENIFAWSSFDGTYVNAHPQLTKPFITLVEDSETENTGG